jgi:S-adenosylmethionine hydrolase
VAGLQQRQLPKGAEAITIIGQRYWRQPVSTTFHGRDILAPVAAHLSLGTPLDEFGEKLGSVNVLPIPQPYRDSKGKLRGQIIHIDRFGNMATNIKGTDLSAEKVIIKISGHKIVGLSQSYAEKEGLAAIIDSSGYLEIALKDGNAAAFLRSKVGDKVELGGG